MDLDKKALKSKLLEIAQRESLKFGEDLNKQMQKNVKLEKNNTEKWVKIIYLGGDFERVPVDKASFEQILRQFSKDKKIADYKIIVEKDFVQFQFKDAKIVDQVYNHYYNLFFGNTQQQMVNSYLTKYINELLEEGCATGSCGCSDESCGAHDHGDESEKVDKKNK